MIRRFAVFVMAGIMLLAPFSASAANVKFFGPIVDERCTCKPNTAENPEDFVSAPDWACVILTVQNVIAVLITFVLVLITFVIAYAGIMMMVDPNNAKHREAGKTMVTNAVLGLIIVLTAWLIVDFVMKAFYNSSQAAKTLNYEAPMLPWNAVISDDATPDQLCFRPKEGAEPKDPDGGLNGGNGGTSSKPSGTHPPVSSNGTATKRPATPTGFSAIPSGTTINLQWNQTSDTSVDWYVIDFAEGNTSYGNEKRISTDENTYTHSGLKPGTTYRYRLFTWNENDYSEGVAAEAKTAGDPPVTAGSPTGCSNCVKVSSSYRSKSASNNGCDLNGGNDGVPQISPALTSCYVSSSINQKLVNLTNPDLNFMTSKWWVTEMWPPTTNHENSCHANGTCVDISFSNNSDYNLETIKQFLAAAKQVGIRAVFEEDSNGNSANCTLVSDIKAAGYEALCINVQGDHFSIY